LTTINDITIAIANVELEGCRVTEPLRTILLSNGSFDFNTLRDTLMKPENEIAWTPEDGFAEEISLEEIKTIRKLELLNHFFDGLGDRIIGKDVIIKSFDIDHLESIKVLIEKATTVEELICLRIENDVL